MRADFSGGSISSNGGALLLRKARLFTEFEYGARSRSRPRRVIARIEHGPKGRNPRFIVTHLAGAS